jgi:hypothetical protein
MKNNTDAMIQNIKKINNNTERTEGDDEFFFVEGLFKSTESFLGGFSFLEVFVDLRVVI